MEFTVLFLTRYRIFDPCWSVRARKRHDGGRVPAGIPGLNVTAKIMENTTIINMPYGGVVGGIEAVSYARKRCQVLGAASSEMEDTNSMGLGTIPRIILACTAPCSSKFMFNSH